MRASRAGRAALRSVQGAGLAALLATAGANGCEFDEQTVAPGDARLAVHAVLNPGAGDQTVLVERTLTGNAQMDDGLRPDPLDPIVSRRGVPVSGARVVVYGPSGDSAVAVEDRTVRADRKGAGVYRFRNAATSPGPGPFAGAFIPILAGAQYRLRVTSPEGDLVTGETTVPQARPVVVPIPQRNFNRDTDSLFLFWERVPLAERYELRFDAPHGAFALYVDSLEYLIAGGVRDPFSEGFPAVFVPGFTEAVTVGAVDRNYFDYYRSANDPFTGHGLISHLDGGFGFFGSYVLLRAGAVQVTATVDEAIEGTYARVVGPFSLPGGLVLYVESHSGVRTQITGNAATGSISQAPPGVIGVLDGQLQIVLALLAGQSIADTVAVLDGRFDGASITGTVRGSGAPIEYRQIRRAGR
ncbi:MAG: DUF4249 family protein [Gemmatimonadaceae bacterium]